MYSREKVELFLLATEDGMGPTAAAEFAGVSVAASAGQHPASHTGARCRIVARKPPRVARPAWALTSRSTPRAGDRPARRAQRGPDREPAAQGGVGRPARKGGTRLDSRTGACELGERLRRATRPTCSDHSFEYQLP